MDGRRRVLCNVNDMVTSKVIGLKVQQPCINLTATRMKLDPFYELLKLVYWSRSFSIFIARLFL